MRNLDQESSAVLKKDGRLLDMILELSKKSNFTKAVQGALDTLNTERDKLHATEAWQRVLAERR